MIYDFSNDIMRILIEYFPEIIRSGEQMDWLENLTKLFGNCINFKPGEVEKKFTDRSNGTYRITKAGNLGEEKNVKIDFITNYGNVDQIQKVGVRGDFLTHLFFYGSGSIKGCILDDVGGLVYLDFEQNHKKKMVGNFRYYDKDAVEFVRNKVGDNPLYTTKKFDSYEEPNREGYICVELMGFGVDFFENCGLSPDASSELNDGLSYADVVNGVIATIASGYKELEKLGVTASKRNLL